MEENQSIIEKIANLNADILEDIEHSSLIVLECYTHISEKFKKDGIYGGEFVKRHPDVIAKLAEAAMLDMRLRQIKNQIETKPQNDL